MKIVQRVFAICLVAGTAAAAEQPFEGKVVQRSVVLPRSALPALLNGGEVTANKVFDVPPERLQKAAEAQTVDAVIYIKGSLFRVDLSVNGKPGYLVADSSTDRTIIAVPADKVYVEWTRADREEAKKKLEAKGQPATPAPTAKVVKTGSVATVDGMTLRTYEYEDGGETSRAWLTQEHANLLAALRGAAKTQQQVRPARATPMEIFSEHGLPIRVQTLTADHYEQIDLLTIEPQPVAADKFTVPTEFRRIDPRATPMAATPVPATPAAP